MGRPHRELGVSGFSCDHDIKRLIRPIYLEVNVKYNKKKQAGNGKFEHARETTRGAKTEGDQPMKHGLPATVSVPEWGQKVLNVSRNQSYALAKAGVIPTISSGVNRLRVPVRIAAARLVNNPTNQMEIDALIQGVLPELTRKGA
jgi:hypothetical protein